MPVIGAEVSELLLFVNGCPILSKAEDGEEEKWHSTSATPLPVQVS